MKNKAFAISMTVLWCITFTSALHDTAVGISLGLMMGVAFGLFSDQDEEKEEKDHE
jgi:Na+/H+ antiporter NhaA